jgi:CRP-like cAMP-binding protein
VNVPQVVAVLRQTELFAELDDRVLEHLAERALTRRLSKGRDVMVEGEKGDTMGVVAEGRVRVVMRSKDGAEAELIRIGPYGHFGLVALLDGGVRTASVEAVESSEVITLERKHVYPLLQTEPRLLDAVFESLCGLIRGADIAYADQRFLTLKQRIAKALRALDLDSPGQRFTQADLANRVGATRQSVNQVLREFERRGFIKHEGRTIVILREEELRRLAAG